MVIINHQTSPSNADAPTDLLLDECNSRGSNVWDCIGKWDFKEEMLSLVMHRYTNVSDFVFPIDVDEYIAVLTPSTSPLSTSSTDATSQALSWSKEDLSRALHKLRDTGRPFKMERGNVYPVDCYIPHWEGKPSISDTMDQSNNPIQNQNHHERSVFEKLQYVARKISGIMDQSNNPIQNQKQNHYERSVFEKLQYVARRNQGRADCMDKVFFRGKDFNFTDAGNHHGQTHIQPWKFSYRRCNRFMLNETKFKKYVHEAYNDLFMVHMQFTTMEEWMMHGLRGAADEGFNRFEEDLNCPQGRNAHYCLKFQKLMNAKFDPSAIRRLYREEVCTELVNGMIPVPIGEILNVS